MSVFLAIIIVVGIVSVTIISIYSNSKGIYHEEFELNILGVLKYKSKNKEKRLEGGETPSNRDNKKH
ncbi:hypothetical protein [Clostridium sp. DJ247]|uniref:hypothetical protein n=1 Tax=Clostridium sp. DJ247 TaxID=2726188 RepID=UPI00162ADCD2|nr:hypothetical protein [Clostridium sp. DJ247]MBC2581947.1 hypothetical protein [Clostridium sp. DJ247]